MAIGGGWTVETLLEHFRDVIKDRDVALGTALAANEKRLDTMNEMRSQLNDQASKFLTRDEYAARHEQLISELTRLRERMDNLSGAQQAARRLTTAMLAAIGVAVALGTLITYIVVGHP